MDLGLRGLTALITGGSKGIGRGVAEVLAEEGCDLVLAARTGADLDRAAAEIGARHNVRVETRAADLSRAEEVDALGTGFRHADILVNNAGAIPHGRLDTLGDAALREAWELKLFGYINLTRHLYAAMCERRAGVIVNIIGGAANNPTPGYYAGAGANAALQAITIALGKESPEHGVRILGLHPGPVRTERLQDIWETQAEMRLGDRARWREVVPSYAFGRPVEPAEVGAMVAFLASAKASYTSGVVLSLAGGR